MSTDGPTVRAITSDRGVLPEGLHVSLVDDATTSVRWVDIARATLHHVLLDDGGHRQGPVRTLQLAHAASVVLDVDGEGGDGVLLGDELGLARVAEDGTVTRLAPLPPQAPGMRANDGVLLADGTVLLGTMSRTDPRGVPGRVHRFAPGADVGDPIGPAVHIPNTFLPLPDGSVLVADSLRGLLLRMDPSTGATTTHPATALVPVGTSPDGGCLHEEEVLVALWDGGALLGFDAATGVPTRRLGLPVPRPTNVAVVPGTDTLVVTSASEGLTAAQLAQAPLSGQVLLVAADQR